MNTHTTLPQTDSELDGLDEELAGLSGAIAAQLAVKAPAAPRGASIAANLLRRARDSALAHRNFVTRRREEAAFADVADGMRACTLREDGGIRIELVHLAAAAAMVWPEGVLAQEVLVMSGSLLVGQDNTLAPYELCLHRDRSQTLRGGNNGAQLYVRQLIALAPLPAIEQTWWTGAEVSHATEWQPLSEGVEIKTLRCVGEVMSSLARVAPGALVVNHGHTLDEDCMMLQGDLFLGDILLRANDYQLAPAGGTHTNSMSDTGAVFYFHGHTPTAI